MDQEKLNAGPKTELLHTNESFLSAVRAGVTHENAPPRNMQPDSLCQRPELNTKIDECTTENQYHNAESVPQRCGPRDEYHSYFFKHSRSILN